MHDATKQLAYIYREDGQTARSAAEHERISAEATDPDLSREALLTAGEMYDEVRAMDDAIRVYEEYVDAWPLPLDLAMQTRTRLSEIYRGQSDFQKYLEELNEIVEQDREAGPERTDRSRFLASQGRAGALGKNVRAVQAHSPDAAFRGKPCAQATANG